MAHLRFTRRRVARLAGAFLQVFLLCIPPMILFESIRRFHQVQNIVRPFLWRVIFVAVAAHPFYLYMCLTYMQLGVIGAAVATTLSFTTLCAMSLVHAVSAS
jgi:Na+-driven multidrug efflux pump